MTLPATTSTPCENFGRGRMPSSLHIAVYAKFPKHTTTRTLLNSCFSRTRNAVHWSRSSLVGLLSGGAHFTTDDTHAPVNARPSSDETDSACDANPARYIARYNQSPLLSPVNMRPVLLAPCAAGAKPTTQTVAFGSPNPGTALPQYSSLRKDARLSRATDSRHSTNRGHDRHSQTSVRNCSKESTSTTVG